MQGPDRWVRERWWTARRFGLTPAGVAGRLRRGSGPRVLCVTVPKSGTHLLERVLCLHPALHRPLVPTIHEGNLHDRGGLRTLLPRLRPGQVLLAHLPHQPQFESAVAEVDARLLLLVRDPRDVAVSEVHYTLARPEVPGHDALRAAPDLHARLRIVIEGGPGLAPLATRLGRFAGWLSTGALLVRFEDLVGPAGGGDADRQAAAMRAVYEHVGVPVDDRSLARLQRQVFSSSSPTFRRGRVGGWREDFTPDLEARFDREAGALLPVFGYAGDAS